MRGKKKILQALPDLTCRELWFVEFDNHRAADVAAIGGATAAQWQQYVDVEHAARVERMRRFPGAECPFLNALCHGWSDAEIKEMGNMYKRIFTKKKKEVRNEA